MATRTRYLLSPCCNGYVYVPVEVTAHFYVRGDSTISNSLADRLSDIRRQAIGGSADIAEAYCAECGAEVSAA